MRILLILPTESYRAPDFLEAARRLKADLILGSELKNPLSSVNPEGYLQLDFEDYEGSAKSVEKISKGRPIQAVLGVDDATTGLAAFIARRLSLPANPVEAVEAARNKRLMRECLQRAGVPIPDYRVFSADQAPEPLKRRFPYPCVLKPTMLSASQGVIRADDPAQFVEAWDRIKRIIESRKTAPEILVESYIPGQEVALEGLLENASLRVLAIFDKPDPLEGPFFEETIYVRPSRLAIELQNQIISCAAGAARALGLSTGPVHAELRINRHGPWLIEMAARPLGGRCSRALRCLGMSLEELILKSALGLDTRSVLTDPTPSGVMMIPIQRAGVLRQVDGIEEAKSVSGVEDVLIMAHKGETLVPIPEGSRYLGFIFCRAETPDLVVETLRKSHSCLKFEVEPSTEAAAPVAEVRCHAT